MNTDDHQITLPTIDLCAQHVTNSSNSASGKITTFMTHHSREIMTSESEDLENESISTVSEVSDVAPEDVAELTPSVSCCVKDSSDVHVGTRNQYNTPVTVQNYKVTVNNEIQGLNFVPKFSVTQPSPFLQLLPPKTYPGPTEPAVPLEEPNYHTLNLNDNNDLEEAPCRYLGGLIPKFGNVSTGICAGTVIALILTISMTVLVYYLGDETSNLSKENSFSFIVHTSHGNDSVDVGTEYVFWKVKVNTTFSPEFQWFGPQGEAPLEGNSSKYVIDGSSERSESGLTLFSVELSDAGEYRLHVLDKVRPEVKKFITVTLTIKIREPPDMVPKLAEDELQTGDNITLQCTARNPITWSYPRQHLDRSTEGESSVYITEVRRQQCYESTLHVSRADYLDTGFYGCTVNESYSLFYPNNTTRTYIYVRDDEHLLVGQKDSIAVFDVSVFEPVVIPCRTTARDIKISLQHTFVPEINNNNNNNNNKPFEVTSIDIKVGFTLQQVIQDIAVTCIATRGSTTENILYVLFVHKLPQKHTIGSRVCIHG